MRELEQARSAALFATPLLSHIWADGAELNPALRDNILEHARRHSGYQRTNVSGWHSESGMLFPSYVPHAVPPHQGARERISIAFNLRREPFP
jgi:hypothetical protein